MTTYKVSGSTPFQGHQPGETFDADLDEAQERRALARGSISKARAAKAKAEHDDDDDNEQEG